MSGPSVPPRPDVHHEVRNLLPWFVTGRLEHDDLNLVEGHLANCADCRAEAVVERRLCEEVAAIPTHVSPGWARMSGLLDSAPRRGSVGAVLADRVGARWRSLGLAGPRWVGWALAAQVVLVVAMAWVAWKPAASPSVYHVLGAAPVARPGNVMVIFRPETREVDLREILHTGHARLVDGPTASDGYMLSVPDAERARAVASLRSDPRVVFAEPIDGERAP